MAQSLAILWASLRAAHHGLHELLGGHVDACEAIVHGLKLFLRWCAMINYKLHSKDKMNKEREGRYKE